MTSERDRFAKERRKTLQPECGILRAPENVIDGHMVIIGKCYQMFQRYGLKPALIPGIDGLLDVQDGGYVGLGQIMIFTKITQTTQIYGTHLPVKYQ